MVWEQILAVRNKLFVYQSVYVPILTYGHKLWGVAEIMLVELVLDNLGKAQSRATASSN